MSENKLEKIIERIIGSTRKNLRLISTILLIGAVAIVFLSWSSARNKEKELELSGKVNSLIFQMSQIKSSDQLEEEKAASKEQVRSSLVNIHRENTGSQNGKRALLVAANSEYEEGKFGGARDKYMTVFNSGKKGPLAPIALYMAALTWEEEGKFQAAVDLLLDFKTRYPGHFYVDSAYLSLARVYEQLGNVAQAQAVIKELSGLGGGQFKEKADRWSAMNKLKTLVRPDNNPLGEENPGTIPGLPQTTPAGGAGTLQLPPQ